MIWALSLIPSWFYHVLVGFGLVAYLVGTFLTAIPVIGRDAAIIKPIGILIFCIGIFFEGGYLNQKAWEARVAELQEQVRVAEEKSKEENVKIVEKVVTKREYYKERGKDIIQYIDREIVKYDESCKIPKEVVDAHNRAASSMEQTK